MSPCTRPFLPTPDAATWNAGLQWLQRDRHPGEKRSAGGVHALLNPVQINAGKAQAPFPVRINPAPFPGQADRITLQSADQHSDRDHHQQPINPLGVTQPTALKLEDPRSLVAEQLLAAEALPVSPHQIKAGLQVAHQIPGLGVCDANGSGQNQIGLMAALPEPHTTESTAMAAGQAESAHLTAHRRGGAVNPGIGAQPHHIAPAGSSVEPAEQLTAGEGPIRQHGDRVKP